MYIIGLCQRHVAAERRHSRPNFTTGLFSQFLSILIVVCTRQLSELEPAFTLQFGKIAAFKDQAFGETAHKPRKYPNLATAKPL